ncbi:type VI secretion system contractile sheath domain-containing protein [Methylomonas koyamae]|uniref:type VI secretion system contractile sheath domain-containing protein n=1 Tax=Methylomonas koyamae TaxID=702114 RepID=UPI002872D0B3|nr:type VI secretion system contractile sheath large subunit [Methylomonas koyamae]WNB74272.1 type VI secretion system contractile sheath large subunit [Methylomonas koyamae]
MADGIDFTMGFQTRGAQRKSSGGEGYRVYVLGSFSGRHEPTWPQRPIRKIDVDNFAQVMRQIAPSIELGPGSALAFEAIEDFHPDAWIGKIKLLADLQQLKRDLHNPHNAEQAAAKIRAFFPASAPAPIPAEPAGESQEDMLERLLGKRPEATSPATDSVERLIRDMVAPHVAKSVSAEHQALAAVVDATISQFIATLLHSPDFRGLEALWLALRDLLNEEGADAQQWFLLDLSQQELAQAAQNEPDMLKQKLAAHLQTADAGRQVLLLGDYTFNADGQDRPTLRYCSALAAACHARFVTAAGHELAANLLNPASATGQQWPEICAEVGGERLMLAYPGILQRLPYGAKRDPLQGLDFEECGVPPDPAELLWSNPAFLAARFLVKAEQTVDESTGFFGDVPAFSYPQDGESVLQAATEVVLNEKQAHQLWDRGLIPVVSFRQRRGVKLLDAATLV